VEGQCCPKTRMQGEADIKYADREIPTAAAANGHATVAEQVQEATQVSRR
jgi:hypothetical protein